MPAAYDTYDYPTYWKERVYEHESEVLALKYLLSKIKKIKTLIDIGAGFGRLSSLYLYRAKRVIMVDPSAKILKIARSKHRSKKITFVQSTVQNLSGKLRTNAGDVILLIRVLHHLENIDEALLTIDKICKKGGYLILEFPNKRHLKASVREFFKGNFTYSLDIFPKDRRSKKSIKKNVLPFMNFHPDYINEKLLEHNFKIVERVSVSFFRNEFLKNYIPIDLLLTLEGVLQKTISRFNLSPSIFILAKKTE